MNKSNPNPNKLPAVLFHQGVYCGAIMCIAPDTPSAAGAHTLLVTASVPIRTVCLDTQPEPDPEPEPEESAGEAGAMGGTGAAGLSGLSGLSGL